MVEVVTHKVYSLVQAKSMPILGSFPHGPACLLRYSLLSGLLTVIPLIFNRSASKNDHRPSYKAGSKRHIY